MDFDATDPIKSETGGLLSVTLFDDPHMATLVLVPEVASALRTGDPEARAVVLTACEALVDAYIATHATARHGLN